MIKSLAIVAALSHAALADEIEYPITSYDWEDARKLAGVGLGVSFGVGLSSFTDPTTREVTSGDVGGMWSLRLTFGSHIPVGLETSYTVTTAELDTNGDIGSYLGQSLDAVLRWNVLPHCAWTPYAFGGVGLQMYDVVGTDARVRIEDNVERLAFPVGAGFAYRDRSGLTVDVRGTYRFVDDRAYTPVRVDSWEASASIGHDM